MATLVRALSAVTPVKLGKIETLREKLSTKQRQKLIEPITPIFPLNRYLHQSGNKDYYAYGNTPPEDFLESCMDRKPTVLSLGCGDIRSCFYTLWKHMDETISDAPCRFDDINFTLLDCSAAVLARNVIFIYLALNLPEERKLRKSWLCGMWAIWYCHELSSDHVTMLSDSLKYLISFSASLDEWNSDNNSLKSLICFESSSSLSEVSLVWSMWLEEKVKVNSRKQMLKSRNDLLSVEIQDRYLFCYKYSLIGTYIYGKEPVGHQLSILSSEVESYLRSGSCYAESVLEIKIPSIIKANLTLYERDDGFYTLHYASVPYSAFQQTFHLTYDAKGQDIAVAPKYFQDKPFLSNSVQQFAMWIQSTSRVFKRKSVKFNFHCQDALTFCHERQVIHEKLMADQKFDSIYTSNLVDHMGLPNLVLSCIPLLKDKSFLFTSSMASKNCTGNLDEFLKVCFGFDCTLLPVLLGIRCVNHEGKDYSSPVSLQPFPPDVACESPGLPHVRFLVWERCPNSLHMCMTKLPAIELGSITDAMVNLVGTCAFAHLNPGPGMSYLVLSFNTTLTATLMLHCFATHLVENIRTNYIFWEPLCAALRQVSGPFSVCLQTHLFLYNIHIHLVVTEKDCPMCNKEQMENVVGSFSVKFAIKDLSLGRKRPLFYALVHKASSLLTKQDLFNDALNGKDVHIFDSFDSSVIDNNLELTFLAPFQLASQNYKVAIVYCFFGSTDIYSVTDTTMAKALSSSKKYHFFQPDTKIVSSKSNAELGSVVLHSYSSCTTETVIALSNAAQAALLANKLCKERISLCEFRISCGSLSFDLCFSYPVDLESVDIKQTVTAEVQIICKRIKHRFIDERPHCIISPDHQLSLPQIRADMTNIIKRQSGMQFTSEESSSNLKSMVKDLPALVRTKIAVQNIFEGSSSCHFYQLLNRQNNDILLIVVNTIVFDYEHQTPAADLAFCKTSQDSVIVKKWKKLFHSCSGRQNFLDSVQFTMLMETLTYFMERTNGNLKKEIQSPFFSQLFLNNIDQFFFSSSPLLPPL